MIRWRFNPSVRLISRLNDGSIAAGHINVLMTGLEGRWEACTRPERNPWITRHLGPVALTLLLMWLSWLLWSIDTQKLDLFLPLFSSSSQAVLCGQEHCLVASNVWSVCIHAHQMKARPNKGSQGEKMDPIQGGHPP